MDVLLKNIVNVIHFPNKSQHNYFIPYETTFINYFLFDSSL